MTKPVIQFAGEEALDSGIEEIFESLDYLIRHDRRDGGEFQLTAAQEHLRQAHDRYHVATVHGQRYDTGIPYGLMETQLALGLTGIHRGPIYESITRILASQARV